MASKKKSVKKSQTTWQWFRSLSNGYKISLFVVIFAVLGGGFAVYKSFAFSWFRVVHTSLGDVSVCEYPVTKVGMQARWAFYNNDTRTNRLHVQAVSVSGQVAYDITGQTVAPGQVGITSPAGALPEGNLAYYFYMVPGPDGPQGTLLGVDKLNPDFLQHCDPSGK